MKLYFNLLILTLVTAGMGCKKDNPAVPPATPPVAGPPAKEKKWIVTTIAGDGTRDLADGPALSAHFAVPEDVVVAPDGTIYITDVLNGLIRKLADGQVTTFAGRNDAFDIVNGIGGQAVFMSPFSIAMDGAGNLYTSDENDPRVRKITPGAVVSTFAGLGMEGFADGRADTAQFRDGSSLAADGQGNVYMADYRNDRIRKISSSGVVSTIAGTDTFGFRNGTGGAALFGSPGGTVVDKDGNLYVADRLNFRIRKLSPGGVVTSFAGSGVQGNADGDADVAQFDEMRDMVMDGQGNLYLSDADRVRKISPQGAVTTIAGSTAGFADGDGLLAKFNVAGGLGIDSQGKIYVADLNNNRIRKISWQ